MKIKIICLTLLLLVSLMAISCVEQEVVYNSVTIDKFIFADEMGNEDGSASIDELNAVSEYFLNNSLAYFLLGSLNDYDAPLAGSGVISGFNIMSDLYSSETQMREAFDGVGIKTPWVTISLAILVDGEITITHIYRAPGPNVSEGNWERVEVE